MRRIFFLFILVIVIVACNPGVKGKNGVTYKSAVQYNDYIVNRQTILIKNLRDFSNVANRNLDSAEVKLRLYADATSKMIEEIKGMPPYKGDSGLRDAAIRSFSFYKKVFENDYIDILQIKKKGLTKTDEDVKTA